jgi:hypothetical protein
VGGLHFLNVSVTQYIDTSVFCAQDHHVLPVEGLVIAAFFLTLLCLFATSIVNGTVSRRRLERFAKQQALPITVDNGSLVIRYLATTRRWRSAGLLVAAVLFTTWSAQLGGFSLNLLELFAGWFVGAVVAEWRLAAAATGGKRAARLVPRRSRDYLRLPARALPGMVFVICAGVAIVDAVGALNGRHAVWGQLVPWVLVTAVGLALVYAVQRRVLTRPQPVVAPDVLAADAAIRARSLQVLAGSAVAAAGLPAAELIHTLQLAYPHLGAGGISDVSALMFLGALLVGRVLAYSSVRTPVDGAYAS